MLGISLDSILTSYQQQGHKFIRKRRRVLFVLQYDLWLVGHEDKYCDGWERILITLFSCTRSSNKTAMLCCTVLLFVIHFPWLAV